MPEEFTVDELKAAYPNIQDEINARAQQGWSAQQINDEIRGYLSEGLGGIGGDPNKKLSFDIMLRNLGVPQEGIQPSAPAQAPEPPAAQTFAQGVVRGVTAPAERLYRPYTAPTTGLTSPAGAGEALGMTVPWVMTEATLRRVLPYLSPFMRTLIQSGSPWARPFLWGGAAALTQLPQISEHPLLESALAGLFGGGIGAASIPAGKYVAQPVKKVLQQIKAQLLKAPTKEAGKAARVLEQLASAPESILSKTPPSPIPKPYASPLHEAWEVTMKPRIGPKYQLPVPPGKTPVRPGEYRTFVAPESGGYIPRRDPKTGRMMPPERGAAEIVTGIEPRPSAGAFVEPPVVPGEARGLGLKPQTRGLAEPPLEFTDPQIRQLWDEILQQNPTLTQRQVIERLYERLQQIKWESLNQ